MLRLENISYVYGEHTAEEKKALNNISLTIGKDEFVGIIGHTGSGKSTLIQHLDGLLKATRGTIYFNNKNVYKKGFDLKKLRTKVGLVFQYPEYQLFENTVFEDICFGIKKQNFDEKEIKYRAEKSLALVNIEKDLYDVLPFELSGGQKRRVAIAGVLAMQPEILVLDEPTAGLDPKGKKDILNLLKDLKEKTNMSIVLVSHSMEDVANYVERLIVMNDGKILFDDKPKNIFLEHEKLKSIGLNVPQVTELIEKLRKEGLDIKGNVTTVKEAKESILKFMKEKKG